MLPKFIPMILLLCLSYNEKNLNRELKIRNQYQISGIYNPYKRIADIPLPAGFEKINYPAGSFAQWLRNIELKPGRTVYKFDGTVKHNQTAQFAVLTISVGKQNLQQCADALMRLRAEYLYDKKDFQQISFADNNNTIYRYHQPYTRNAFDKYLLKVFGMCGSASLSKQLKKQVHIKDVQGGDVLIRGGFPGHAVIVMDVAINSSGKKVYLLAQSYMPAQDIHVLVNPLNKKLSPWYEVNDETLIPTPEYTFSKYELKRW